MTGVFSGMAMLAQATSIGISTPSSLNGNYAYSFGVQISMPADQQINSMTISFDHVQLASAPKGYLYVDLLDFNWAGSSKSYWDGDKAGDYFSSSLKAGQGIALGVQQFNYYNQTVSWSYTLGPSELAALNAYLVDGVFNLGLDPDCYFKNFRSSCTISYNTCDKPRTTCVPDSAMTAGLLCMGLMGLVAFGRKSCFNQA